ncbi:DUF4326 domain-containing protein [Anabaena sp. UHCC 0187]|uniref:DUF4326 domain-containing protein n=1 Tax=Anabaena sp. UHCC 0187 TaxID=2590018 RepID=UPI0020C36134|nr:DUF4326 domain-containing protein [Anabaena sp. UHCC 0187]
MKVANGKTTGFIGENRIYIGRANSYYDLPESPLHNPFKMSGNGESEREKVCSFFHKYLYHKILKWSQTGELDETTSALRDICLKLVAGEEIILTCWCKPYQCHGDNIIRAAEWIIKQDWFKSAYSEYF